MILLDGKVVVGLSSEEIVSYRALGEKGIGSDGLAFDIDRVKKRDGCFDLIRPFDVLIAYPETAYFFWV